MSYYGDETTDRAVDAWLRLQRKADLIIDRPARHEVRREGNRIFIQSRGEIIEYYVHQQHEKEVFSLRESNKFRRARRFVQTWAGPTVR